MKDIDYYIDKAVEKMKDTYFWADKSMFRKEYTYNIEKENDKDVFVSYYRWSDGWIDRSVHDISEEEFIDLIISDNSRWVEKGNPTKEIFDVPFKSGTDAHGWNLEIYQFRTHELGGYSSYIQAGDRYTGGSREFFIPNSYFDGTYDEFLDKYCELAPGNFFGLYKEDLEKVVGLIVFLGF